MYAIKIQAVDSSADSAPSKTAARAERIDVEEVDRVYDLGVVGRESGRSPDGSLSAVDAARLAGRLNASKVSDKELESLLLERQELLNRQFDGAITRRERNRLEYVRWTLDRIDDARFGGDLDALDSAADRLQRFGDEIRDLKDEINTLVAKRSKRGR